MRGTQGLEAEGSVKKSSMQGRKLSIKNSFIPWSFPEIVAVEEGIFGEKGLDVSLFTLSPSAVEPGDKPNWYGQLVDEGKVDAYSCCAWAALDRLGEGGRKKIVGATSSLNYAFSVFVQADSVTRNVEDLADVEIQVNLRTGSHYCNLRQLEEHIHYDRIRLVHGGAPHNRLLSLMTGDAKAVSLISPYTQVADELGFRKVFETDMVDVLAFIVRSDMPEADTGAFLDSINEAIRRVNANPAKYKPLYLKILAQTFEGYPQPQKSMVEAAAKKAESRIDVVRWTALKPYAEETFSTINRWMSSHNLLEHPITYEQLVNNAPLEKVLASSG